MAHFETNPQNYLLDCSFYFAKLSFSIRCTSTKKKEKKMTSLADDLLKSRSIQQLTCVVQNLSNEVMNKQKELQGMVGSQYNQFIRSADKIIDMRNRSTSLIISLKDFVSQSSYISDSFDKLMQQNCLISLNKLESVLEQGKSFFIWVTFSHDSRSFSR